MNKNLAVFLATCTGLGVLALTLATGASGVGSGPAFSDGKNPRVRAVATITIGSSGLAKGATVSADVFVVPSGKVGDFTLRLNGAFEESPPGSGKMIGGFACESRSYCVTVDGVPFRCHKDAYDVSVVANQLGIHHLGPVEPGTKIGVTLYACPFGPSTPAGPVKLSAELSGVLYRK